MQTKYKILISITFFPFFFYTQNEKCKTIGNKKSGLYVEYYLNCQKKIECYFKNGKYDSVYIERKENGKLKIRGQYKNGKKQGVWRHEGVLISGAKAKNYVYSEYTYEKGILRRAYEYISMGDSSAKKGSEKFIIYGNDTIEKQHVFHDNGILAYETFFINGKTDSIWSVWDETGRLWRKEYKKQSKSVKEIEYKSDYQTVLLFKNGYETVLKQYDLKGTIFYEEYYDTGKRIINNTLIKRKIIKTKGIKRETKL